LARRRPRLYRDGLLAQFPAGAIASNLPQRSPISDGSTTDNVLLVLLLPVIMLPPGRWLLVAMLLLQPADRTSVWDGVYTAAQAERGGTVYEARCSRCHASDLRGVSGSSLAGDGFMRHWEGRTIDGLFRRIHDTMPPDAAGTVTEREALDTVAYVFQRNGFPEGSRELAAEPAALAGILIKSLSGPVVVRSGALVQATGCLTPDRDNGWTLIGATEPEVTTLDAQPSGAREPGAAIPGGTRTIALMQVFPNPAPHKGHTMRARGFLIKDPAGDRINVVTLEMIESQCVR
jgi:mono/diheme cytochrome c family protein